MRYEAQIILHSPKCEEKNIQASSLGKCLEIGRVEHDWGQEEHQCDRRHVGRKRIRCDVAGKVEWEGPPDRSKCKAQLMLSRGGW